MQEEPPLLSRACTPATLFSHWAWSLRAAMNVDKNDIASAEVEHVDPRRSEKGAVNFLLVFSCIVFGAASFIFGYDDKLISPLAALIPFVSAFSIDRCYSIQMLTAPLGREIPGTQSSNRKIRSHGPQSRSCVLDPPSWRCIRWTGGLAIEFPPWPQVACGGGVHYLNRWRAPAGLRA